MGPVQALRACKPEVEAVLKRLTFREREVVKLLLGRGDGTQYSVQETARIFKTTKGRIEHIAMKAVQKLAKDGVVPEGMADALGPPSRKPNLPSPPARRNAGDD